MTPEELTQHQIGLSRHTRPRHAPGCWCAECLLWAEIDRLTALNRELVGLLDLWRSASIAGGRAFNEDTLYAALQVTNRLIAKAEKEAAEKTMREALMQAKSSGKPETKGG